MERREEQGSRERAGAAGLAAGGMTKKALRSRILQARRALTAEQVRERSEEICRRVQQMPQWQEAASLCVYMPINQEVEADRLIAPALAAGKRVYIPKVCGREMIFNAWDPDLISEQGNYHIRESASEEVLVPDARTLIIMPGAVFDLACHRIGYGGGYYDKYLSRYPDCRTMAVCFDLQIVDVLPAEEHDICPQWIVSEKRILTAEGVGSTETGLCGRTEAGREAHNRSDDVGSTEESENVDGEIR